MNVLDVNVVVGLYHPDHPHHASALTWWEDCRAAGEPFTVPDLVWVAFARLITNRAVFSIPATFGQAWSFVRAVMQQDTYARYASDERVLDEFARLSEAARANGNLITDAYVAAVAASLGATVVTFDRDFRKFDGVGVIELA